MSFRFKNEREKGYFTLCVRLFNIDSNKTMKKTKK